MKSSLSPSHLTLIEVTHYMLGKHILGCSLVSQKPPAKCKGLLSCSLLTVLPEIEFDTDSGNRKVYLVIGYKHCLWREI
ncbi:unnamed protein product [Lepidochelys olivacea]